VLLQVEGRPLQIVFQRHDAESATAFDNVDEGQTVVVEAELQGASPKGQSEHPVYAYSRLVPVDGRKPAKPRAASGPAYRGNVTRFNYARHGAANGVVLDTGDFIHLKPEGMARLKLKIGDKVEADGDAQMLAGGTGWAVEAVTVNGKAVQHG